LGNLDIQGIILNAFEQAQNTEANHGKNVAALYKIHKKSARGATQGNSIAKEEREFQDLFFVTLSRILPLKKGVRQVERIVKLVGTYVKYLSQRISELQEEWFNETGQQQADTLATRFTERLIRFLLKGDKSRDKNVRYRVLHVLTTVIENLGEIDEDVLVDLHNALIERLDDREAIVRNQAVLALCQMFPGDPLEDARQTINALLDVLDSDPSPEVRRTILQKLPLQQAVAKELITPKAIITKILRRMRDTDTGVRKVILSVLGRCIYSDVTDEDTGNKELGITHPRQLAPKVRKLIIKHGLFDSDPGVKKAASTLVSSWAEALEQEMPKSEEKRPTYEVVISFLQLLEIVSLDMEDENEVARTAVKCVFKEKSAIYDEIDFQGILVDLPMRTTPLINLIQMRIGMTSHRKPHSWPPHLSSTRWKMVILVLHAVKQPFQWLQTYPTEFISTTNCF
jgi:condensin complex subunit 3